MAQQPMGNDLLDNVQGDILVGIPKKTQLFFFFTIEDSQVQHFKTQLGKLLPLITTGAGTQHDRSRIIAHKRSRARGFVALAEVNIAFSHTGLQKLGFDKNEGDKIGDDVFDKGMQADIPTIADNASDWLPEFKTAIDGTILVAADSHESIQQRLDGVKVILGKTVREVFLVRGDARPGAESGHEHFGFADGISEPAIAGFHTPLPGQDPIPEGVILLGRDGDATPTRPEWAKDGSFLCFRMLAQRVPEFDAFLSANAIKINDPSAPQDLGKDLLGARTVGRWKSGAPVDVTPLRDDPVLGADRQRNNFFNFSNDSDPPSRCPFAAHVRKTNPRSDLAVDPEKNLVPHRIIRRGIAFGTEVTEDEKRTQTTKQNRGLLFVCYQSSLANGFQFIQKSWANNEGFIFGKSQKPGFDPIIGQNAGDIERTTAGPNPSDASGPALSLGFKEWVVSLGGEYFFSPSIKGLKTFAGVV